MTMKTTTKLLLLAVCSPFCLVACGGSPSVTCIDGTIVANEINDYAFSSSFMLPSVSV